MTGFVSPYCWLICASSAGVRACAWPARMFRMVVARSPGRASCAKKATVAAPHSTTTAAPTLRSRVKATARPRRGRIPFTAIDTASAIGPAGSAGSAAAVSSLDEVGVIERRSSLCVLLPDPVQLRRDRERAEPVVDADRQGVLGDVVLGLLVGGVLRLQGRGGVAVEDVLLERRVVVE